MAIASEHIQDNPHYPITGEHWDEPFQRINNGRILFLKPTERMDYTDIKGAKNIPRIDLSKPPIQSHDKSISEPSSSRHLFEKPRSLERLIPEKRYLEKYPFIPSCRDLSSHRPRLFVDHPREETKEAYHSAIHVDLNKPAHKAIEILKPERKDLFAVPRDVMKTDDIPGCHPKAAFNPASPPRDTNNITIPNSSRLFASPRLISKYSDPEYIHSKPQIDLSKPVRSPFITAEDNRPHLFQKPRDLLKLPEDMKKGIFLIKRDPQPVEYVSPRSHLFDVPRQTNKIDDIDGTRPKKFIKHCRGPTFQPDSFF